MLLIIILSILLLLFFIMLFSWLLLIIIIIILVLLLLLILLIWRGFRCQELNIGLRLVERLGFRIQRSALLHRLEARDLQGLACVGDCRNPWELLRPCAGLLTDNPAVLVLDQVRRLQATNGLLLLSAEHQDFPETALCNLAHLLLFLLRLFNCFLRFFLCFLCFFHRFLCYFRCLCYFAFALCCKELNIVL